MATDTTNFTPDMNANSADNEPNFDAVQLAQATPAGAPVQVVIPAGATVVRVPVTAGETIELPFGADAHLLGKLGDNGNLAIKVGDITVILEGYTAAEGQQPVIIETSEGKPVDVATVLAATDPGLDIQTAAGGAEGAQGADNTGAIFEAFGPGNGIGGFGAVGALGATELNYKLIDAEAKFFLEGSGEPDTHPTPTNTEGQVDEDGKKHLHENPFDDCYGGINTDPAQPGDDPWPAKITLKIVDFGPDGPAPVDALVGNIGDGNCYDKNGDQVFSHGEPIVLKWNASEERLEGWVENSSECDGCPRLVFTATVETEGGVATGDICFKLLGPLDHPFNYDPDAVTPVLTLADAETGDGTSGDGDGCCDPYARWHEFEDNIILDLHFDAKDSDDVTSTDIPVAINVDDDSPAFLDCNFDPCQGYTIIADETHGVQCGTDDVDVTFCFLEAIAGQQVEPGESTIFDKFVCFFGYDAVQNLDICDITAAQKHLKFGYGADGPLVHEICCDGSEGNPEAPALQSLGQQGYNQNGDCIINCGALLTNSCGDVYFCEDTGLTITVGDCENTHTLCIKMEGFGNTIFGYAEDYNNQPSFDGGEGGGSCKIPVFIITIDPDTKELTYVQLHQINNDNPHDPNEANDGGEGSCHVLEQINIGLAVTDYDHDSIWTPVHVTVLDDGPKLECVTYNCVETIYENDFSSDDLKGATTIDGYGTSDPVLVSGGQLLLTNETGQPDMQWLKIDGGSEFHGNFHASFDVILSDSGEAGSADGFSFQVGNDINTSGPAEEPQTTGFALTFDTYDNGSPDVVDEVAVWFNGVKLDSRADLGDLNASSPHSVTVDVHGSHYSVIVDGTELFSGNLGGTIPSDADMYFGARTGGAADTQGIDNICITAPCDEAHVDEDFLKKGNHDNDGGPGAHGDDEGSVCATGQVNVDFGRDQPGSFCLDKLTITDDKGCVVYDHCTNNLFTSKGEPVSVEFCGDKVIGIACGQPVFTLTIDCNGCFKFELFQALEHPFHDSDSQNNGPEKNWEDNLNFDFGVKATDCDGDSVCTEIKVSVDDDAPTICGVCYISEDTGYQDTQEALVSRGGQIISCEYGSVDEDFLPAGNHDKDTNPDNLNSPFGDGNNGDGPGGLCVTGHINGKVGADQPGTYTFNIPGLCESGDTVPTCLKTSNGDHPISLVLCQEGCNWVVKGVYDCNGDAEGGEAEAFRVTLDSKCGDFKFELEAALEHPDSNGNPGDNNWDDGFARYEDDICLNFGVKLTDSDGDSACTTLTFKVDDDAPVICDVVYHNQETGQPEVQILTDGGEGSPVPTKSYIGQVDEDFLPNGNHDKDTNPDNLNNPFGDGNNGDGPGGTCVTGCINAKIGADQPGSFLFNIPGLCESGDSVESCYKTSEGYPITLTLCQEGCNWVIKGTYVDGVVVDDPTEEAFKITLDSKTGQFKFELETALQHPDSNGDHSDDATDDGTNRYEDDLLVKFDVKVVDSDGDAAKTCLIFKVDDDAPVQCRVPDWTVDEDAHHTPDSWEPGAPLPGGIEGGPGDSTTDWIAFKDNLGVKFGADGPAAIPYSFAGVTGDPVTGTDSNGAPLGGLTSGGVAILYNWDAGSNTLTGVAGALVVFTAHVDQSNGDVTFQLTGPIDHPFNADSSKVADPSSWEDEVNLDLQFKATDADGDATIAHVTVRVDDDSPLADGGEAPCIAPCDTREEGAHEHFNVDASMITVFDHNGDPATLIINGNGFGVGSDSDGGNGGRFDEINYVGDGATGFPTDSELLLADFGGKVASSADVDLSVFFGSEGKVGNEQGAYQLFLDGVATGEWHIFTANSVGGDFKFHIDGDAGSDGFDQIKFVAIPGSTDTDGNDAGDSSDYSIKNICVDLKACAQSEGDFTFGFGADGPGGVTLVQPDPDTNPAFALTSHGEPIVYTVAADGLSMVGTINGDQPVFELTINPETGKFHFYLYEPIDGPGTDDLHIPFEIQVKDYDGDAVTATIQVCVEQPQTPPTFEDETTVLDEDGLPGGNNPDTVNPQGAGDLVGGHQELGLPVVANEAISRDSLNINWQGDVGTIKFSLTDAQLADIHPLSGAVLTTANVSGNDSGDIKVWDGVPNASNLILEIKVIDAATSVFEAQLYQPIKHTVNGTEDTKDLPVTVTAENGGGPVSHDLQVRINDDLPIASNDYKTLSANGVDTNLMIVLDISGSMADASGLTGLDRLDAARAAINELFERYDSAGNVAVKIVTFSTGSGEEAGGWHTIAEAKAFLDGLNPSGSTNYGAAIAQAEAAFAESGKIGGGQNISYFVSDGKPNPAATGLDAGEQTAWENFVSTNHIVSQAIGIGTGVSAAELDPIAYDGVIHSQIPSIIVTDLNNLGAALIGTVTGGLSGDLDGSPSKFGADGGFIQSVTINGGLFTYNAAANTVGGLGAGSSYDGLNHILSVHTAALDGSFAINLLDGSYNYIRSSDATKSGAESLGYVLSDNDGDTAPGSLIITVPAVDLAPIARDDHVVTNVHNGGGNETFTISDAALMWNDSDANHDPISLLVGNAAISNVSSLTVTHAAPDVTAVDGSGGGSFDYTETANGKDDSAHVTISRAQEDESTLDGNALDNILIDRDGSNDTLKGYEGRDVLIGGNGDTNFIGGRGDDLIDLSKGGNDTVTIESKLDGNDLLVGFSTGLAASNDQVNLDGLFDSYGAMSGTRADHVNTTQVGADVSVNVDTDNNTGNGFEMHITIQNVALANINVGVSNGDNEVILGS